MSLSSLFLSLLLCLFVFLYASICTTTATTSCYALLFFFFLRDVFAGLHCAPLHFFPAFTISSSSPTLEHMEELLTIYVSLQGGSAADALLYRTLNFAKRRSFAAFHTICWRVFVGLLPTNLNAGTCIEEWASCTERNIHEWKTMNDLLNLRLRDDISTAACSGGKSRFGESDSSGDDDENQVSENPLLPTAGSAYAFRYHVDAIRATAQKDIDRIHWDLPIFEQSTTTEGLCSIIVNYCLRHNCDYRQGMHEIAAFVVYLTHFDATLIEELGKSCTVMDVSLIEKFKLLCPVDGVFALSFMLFEAIMGPAGMHLSRWYYMNQDCSSDDIVSAAQKVQGECLAQVDLSLHHQMNEVYKIEGTSYLIRWLRLLFLREFSLAQCADLWDVFLSERFLLRDSEYRLTDGMVTMFAAFMILFVKADLMVDCINALKRVMKYPPVEDVGVLVQRTIAEIDPGNSGIGFYFTPPARFEEEMKMMRTREEEETLENSPDVHAQNAPTCSASPREIMKQQGAILTSIIENLEKRWFPSPFASQEEEENVTKNYLLSIAELKRVRDVLLFRVGSDLKGI